MLVVVLAVGVEPGLSVADDGVIPLFLLAAEFAVTVDAAKSSPGRHRQDQHASHQTYGDTIALFHGVFLLVGVNERILQDLPKNPNPERVSFYSAYYNSDS